MSRARCWNLRFNLDIFNSAFASLDTDQERSDFLIGLSRGANGGKVKDDCSDPMSVGYAIGTEMRGEAEAFRAKAVETGSMRKSNRNDHTVDGPVDQSGTQSTILNPQSTNDNPPSKKESSPSRARPSAKKKESVTPPEHILPKLATIAKDWPRHSDYKGVPTRVSVLARPADVWDRVVRFVAEPDRELAVNCGLVYLDEIDLRDKGADGLIPNVCAMTNFYGEAELWKKMVAKVDETLSKRSEQNDPALTGHKPAPAGQGE